MIPNTQQKRLYDVLRAVPKEITLNDLAKKLKWTEQELLDVAVPLSKEFKEYNKRHFLKILVTYDKEKLYSYFQQFVIDCSLQLETKLIELNKRGKMKEETYQTYLKMWKKYRGY
jgi:hypothetical protein